MASIFELFRAKAKAEQAIKGFERDKEQAIRDLEKARVDYEQEIERLHQLHPEEYTSSQESLRKKKESLQDELANHLALVFAYMKLVEDKVKNVLSHDLLDAFINSSRYL